MVKPKPQTILHYTTFQLTIGQRPVRIDGEHTSIRPPSHRASRSIKTPKHNLTKTAVFYFFFLGFFFLVPPPAGAPPAVGAAPDVDSAGVPSRSGSAVVGAAAEGVGAGRRMFCIFSISVRLRDSNRLRNMEDWVLNLMHCDRYVRLVWRVGSRGTYGCVIGDLEYHPPLCGPPFHGVSRLRKRLR